MFGKYVFVVTPEASQPASHPLRPEDRSSAFIPVIVAMGLVAARPARTGAVLGLGSSSLSVRSTRSTLISVLLRATLSPRHPREAEREREGGRESFGKVSRNVGLDALGQSFTVTLNGLFCLFSRILSRDYSFSKFFFFFSLL